MIARAVAALLAIGVLVATSSASARCGDPARNWARSCGAEQQVEVTLTDCPSGVALLESRAPGGAALRVELSHNAKALARVGDVGISPVGEFADWAKEPETTRRAFDAVVACVRARGAGPLLDEVEVRATPVASRAFPWLLVIGVALLVVSRITRDTRRTLFVTGATVASVAAVFALRRWLVPTLFFHQNGQAPLWIEFALRGDSAGYGPGYGEIFRPWVARALRPDLRLILAQEVASAFVPACAFAIARGVGARPTVAVLCGVAVAFDPLAMRLARSESYFATIMTLLMLAAAAIAGPVRRVRFRFFVAALASGFLIAQAARVHPLAWIPSALVPLVVLAGRGPTLRNARHTALAALVVALVVAVTTLPAMRAVLVGDLGSRFLPSALALLRRGALPIAILLALSMASVALRSTRRVGRRVVIVMLVGFAAVLSNIVSIDTRMIASAYVHLFLPSALAGVVALAVLLPARVSSVVVAALFAAHFVHDRRVLIVPTDAAEQEWCMTWRDSLPRGANVVWVERAGLRVLGLPLASSGVNALPIHADHEPHVPESGTRFYYRSSLCSTADGADLCARFESSHRLRLIERRRLPAIPSQPWHTYPVDDIVVELFAIE